MNIPLPYKTKTVLSSIIHSMASSYIQCYSESNDRKWSEVSYLTNIYLFTVSHGVRVPPKVVPEVHLSASYLFER